MGHAVRSVVRSLIVGWSAVLAGACAHPSSSCTAQEQCDPVITCVAGDGGALTCHCAPTFELDPTGRCRPTFSVLRVNGVSVLDPDGGPVPYFLDVDADATSLLIEAAPASPGYAAFFGDGASTSSSPSTSATMGFPAVDERRRVAIDLRSDTGFPGTAVLLVRRASRYRVVSEVPGLCAASVALTGDGRTLAGGKPLFSSEGGGTLFTAHDDGGVDPARALESEHGTMGWTVVLSDDAKRLATANPGIGAPLTVYERSLSAWEPVTLDGAAAFGTGAVAMSRDGRRVLFSANRDGGAAVLEATPVAPGHWTTTPIATGSAGSLGVTSEGSLVVWGDAPSVWRLDRRDGGATPRLVLSGDAGTFGSSLALSDDGAVLVVSARPDRAWIFERVGDDYVQRLELHAPRTPVVSANMAPWEAPVTVSADGTRVAVGLPEFNTIAVAASFDGGWAPRGWVHAAGADCALFGNGVSLSYDGRRLGVAAPGGSAGLYLFEETSP